MTSYTDSCRVARTTTAAANSLVLDCTYIPAACSLPVLFQLILYPILQSRLSFPWEMRERKLEYMDKDVQGMLAPGPQSSPSAETTGLCHQVQQMGRVKNRNPNLNPKHFESRVELEHGPESEKDKEKSNSNFTILATQSPWPSSTAKFPCLSMRRGYMIPFSRFKNQDSLTSSLA